VVGDEVVGVGLGLRTGRQLLAGVLLHRGELRCLDGRAVLGREVDLLLGKLLVHLVADEVVRPREQAAGHHEHRGEEQSHAANQHVERSALHGCVSFTTGTREVRPRGATDPIP